MFLSDDLKKVSMRELESALAETVGRLVKADVRCRIAAIDYAKGLDNVEVKLNLSWLPELVEG